MEQPQRAWEESQSIRSDLRGSWERPGSASEGVQEDAHGSSFTSAAGMQEVYAVHFEIAE